LGQRFQSFEAEDLDNDSSFESSIDVEKRDGDDLEIHLNIDLLEITLKSMDDEIVNWQYIDSDAPSIFTEKETALNLLMPVRRKADGYE